MPEQQTQVMKFLCPWLKFGEGGNSEALVEIQIKNNKASVERAVCSDLRSDGKCWMMINRVGYLPASYQKGGYRYMELYREIQAKLIKEHGLRSNRLSGELNANDAAYIEPKIQVEIEQERVKHEARLKSCFCVLRYGFQNVVSTNSVNKQGLEEKAEEKTE